MSFRRQPPRRAGARAGYYRRFIRGCWIMMVLLLLLVITTTTLTESSSSSSSSSWDDDEPQTTIVELTDANFEHETQASTGMTTGSWFVMFKTKNCKHCQKVSPLFERLAAEVTSAASLAGIVEGGGDEEEEEEAANALAPLAHTNFATVMLPGNWKTAVRFDVRGVPALLYFHRGRLYTFKAPRTYHYMKEFLLLVHNEPRTTKSTAIPPPMSYGQVLWATMKTMRDEFKTMIDGTHGNAGYAVVGFIFVIFSLLSAMVIMCFLPSSSSSSSRSKAKKEEDNNKSKTD